MSFEQYLRTGLVHDDWPLEGVPLPVELDDRIDKIWQGMTREPVNSETQEIYANPAASQAMLEDKNFNVVEWLAGAVAGEFARTGLDAFIGERSKVLRDPYTHKPFIHFYVTRKTSSPTPSIGDALPKQMVCGDCGWRGSESTWRRNCKGFPCELGPNREAARVKADTAIAERKSQTLRGKPQTEAASKDFSIADDLEGLIACHTAECGACGAQFIPIHKYRTVLASLQADNARKDSEIRDLQMLLVRYGDHERLNKTIAWCSTIDKAFEGRCLKCGGTHLGMPGDCMGPPSRARPPHGMQG